jgi:uncharacterized protein YndB with AHSA1/START domain
MIVEQQMNRIEKESVIKASRTRVWKALTNPAEFSQWFRARLSVTEFRVGERVNAVSTYSGHEGTSFFLMITEMTAETTFAWKWAPGGKSVEPAPESDPFTAVVFELEEVPGGTRVKVTETGFDHISLSRRAKAFEDNSKGWEIQMQNLHEYAEQKR